MFGQHLGPAVSVVLRAQFVFCAHAEKSYTPYVPPLQSAFTIVRPVSVRRDEIFCAWKRRGTESFQMQKASTTFPASIGHRCPIKVFSFFFYSRNRLPPPVNVRNIKGRVNACYTRNTLTENIVTNILYALLKRYDRTLRRIRPFSDHGSGHLYYRLTLS